MWAASAPRVAHADPFYQLVGARSLAMAGAHRGLGTSNDTLILNPAGMAAVQRYSAEVQYGYNTHDHISRVLVSAVDSKTSPLAAGLAYTREWGNPSGADVGLNRVYFGLAYALTPGIAFGLTGQNARGAFNLEHERHKQNNFNGTAGAMLSLGQLVGVGVVYDNFVPIKEAELMPPTLGLGASVRTSLLTVAYDYVFDMRRGERHPRTWGAGAETLLLRMLVLRGGYRVGHRDSSRNGPLQRYVTGGAAISHSGGGIEVSAERSIQGPRAWQLVFGMQVAM